MQKTLEQQGVNEEAERPFTWSAGIDALSTRYNATREHVRY